jgi:fatty acid elongase 3
MTVVEKVMGVLLLIAFWMLAESFGLGVEDIFNELNELASVFITGGTLDQTGAAPHESSNATSLLAVVSSPSTFSWQYGRTPGSTLSFVLTSLALYLGGCLLLQRWMRNQPAYQTGPDLRGFTLIVFVHNIITSAGSFIMLVGIIHALAKALTHYPLDTAGWFGLFCDKSELMLDGPKVGSTLGFWSYIYYLSKFYEMADTVVLALKKRPLEFLQMYHHASIVMLCWSWLNGGWTLHWYGMVCNTTVHTFMYYYFAQQTVKRRVWWKKYLTMGQLTQFSTVFMVIVVWCYRVGVNGEQCAGSNTKGGIATVAFAQFVNINYLFLFGSMFARAYYSSASKKQG